MSEKNRPTSPHLQIYKWNISSLTSIAHRLTGVLLYAAILVISWYITYYAYKLGVTDPTIDVVEECDCPITQFFRFAVSAAGVLVVFALYYHSLNGVRHLCWDFGKGFDKHVAKRTGYFVVTLALIFTILTIIYAMSGAPSEVIQ